MCFLCAVFSGQWRPFFWSVPSTVYNKKKSFLTRWFWGSNSLQPFKYKIFNKVFHYISKSIETFSVVMPKTYFTKNWDKLWSDNRFLNRKIPNYSIKVKICISQLIAKIELKQRSLNQIRHCLMVHIQIWHHSFYQKTLKYFNDFQNQHFSVLWLKWTQTMEMKQNQIFSHEPYLNLTSSSIGQ